MNITFEPVLESHIPELLEIYNWYIANSTATFHTNPLPMSEFHSMLMSTDDVFLTTSRTIRCDGVLCGYVYFAPYKKREAYRKSSEITIYLSDAYVGRGIGRLAVAEMEKIARDNGVHTLLSVICGENEGSIKLFDRCGYEKVAHMKEVGIKYGRLLDVVIYQKML